jgi:hypothetical protein
MATTHHPAVTYPVHRIPLTRPFVWLIEGWGDLLHHRGASLAYGLLVSALGALILAYDSSPPDCANFPVARIGGKRRTLNPPCYPCGAIAGVCLDFPEGWL